MSAWANQKPRSVHKCGGDLLLGPRHAHSSYLEHNVADAQTALAAGLPGLLDCVPVPSRSRVLVALLSAPAFRGAGMIPLQDMPLLPPPALTNCVQVPMCHRPAAALLLGSIVAGPVLVGAVASRSPPPLQRGVALPHGCRAWHNYPSLEPASLCLLSLHTPLPDGALAWGLSARRERGYVKANMRHDRHWLYIPPPCLTP